MDTSELEQYMLKDPYISLLYGGVVPKDLLPKNSAKQKMYIVNLDKSDKQGSHWIALFLCDDKLTEYWKKSHYAYKLLFESTFHSDNVTEPCTLF